MLLSDSLKFADQQDAGPRPAAVPFANFI